MEDNYYVDFKAVPLAEYETELAQAELLPSRKILQEDIHARFDCLRKSGLQSLNDLLMAVKTPEKIKAFAQKTGLSEEYLAILKREINSSQPQPVKLKDFPAIAPGVIQTLAELGIQTTRQLFDFVKTPGDRQAFSVKTGIPAPVLLELTQLTDVCRIRWVGANFARLLVDSSCDTVEKVAQANHAELYAELMKISAEKQYFKGKFGLNDMRLCVLAARQVPRAIQYE